MASAEENAKRLLWFPQGKGKDFLSTLSLSYFIFHAMPLCPLTYLRVEDKLFTIHVTGHENPSLHTLPLGKMLLLQGQDNQSNSYLLDTHKTPIRQMEQTTYFQRQTHKMSIFEDFLP